ncbi:EamA family transporter [Halobellus clavatus]|jgi:transporter family protein|uniref:Transporter family protein n=1 Tax=Halobellus clavatus TaxID=660517 RepID=A0A1H3FK96_9EURY|nr:EamA family transporter [Halobellus clavatus]SDX91360.1 transporter family protein [Halobellus clavatus]
MARRYLGFSILAFLAYSLVAPLLKIAMEVIPSTPAVFLSNSVLLVVVGVALYYRGESPLPYLRHRYTPHVVALGVLLTVGLLTYYRALALGPVSIVVPIYGLFIVVSSVIGIVAFDESVTPRKIGGICCSVLAIALISL